MTITNKKDIEHYLELYGLTAAIVKYAENCGKNIDKENPVEKIIDSGSEINIILRLDKRQTTPEMVNLTFTTGTVGRV